MRLEDFIDAAKVLRQPVMGWGRFRGNYMWGVPWGGRAFDLALGSPMFNLLFDPVPVKRASLADRIVDDNMFAFRFCLQAKRTGRMHGEGSLRGEVISL